MSEFPLVKLSEVVRLNPRNPDIMPAETDLVTFVPMAAVEAETGRFNASETRAWRTVKKGYARFQENDVLVAKITPCMENGKACVARHLEGLVGAGSTEFHVLRPITSKVEPEWILRFINQHCIRHEAKRHMSGAVGQQRVPASFYQDLQLPLPDLETQQELLERLEDYDIKIEATEQALLAIQAKLKQARASILKAAVAGRLVETEQQPALARSSDPSDQPDHTSERSLPNGWDIHQARAVCTSIESGTTPTKEYLSDSAEGNVPFIKVYNLTFTGRLDFQENQPTYATAEYHASKMKRSKTLPADVLTNIVGPPLGKVSIVPIESDEWNINQAIARFRCGPALLPKFLSIYLQSHQAQSWLASTSKTTTSQVNLSISNCRILPVPVPPISDQQNIVAEVERRFFVLDQVEATVVASLRRCGQLRQAVLKRAFGG